MPTKDVVEGAPTPGWLKEILEEAKKEVDSFPIWMKRTEDDNSPNNSSS